MHAEKVRSFLSRPSQRTARSVSPPSPRSPPGMGMSETPPASYKVGRTDTTKATAPTFNLPVPRHPERASACARSMSPGPALMHGGHEFSGMLPQSNSESIEASAPGSLPASNQINHRSPEATGAAYAGHMHAQEPSRSIVQSSAGVPAHAPCTCMMVAP